MKDQASLNLLIVNSPIDSKALTGHLMLRATSSGLKVYDASGSKSEIRGSVDLFSYEGNVATIAKGSNDYNDVALSMKNGVLSATATTVKFGSTVGTVSTTLSEFGITAAVVNIHSDEWIRYNDNFQNQPGGLVILDSTGKLPAVNLFQN